MNTNELIKHDAKRLYQNKTIQGKKFDENFAIKKSAQCLAAKELLRDGIWEITYMTKDKKRFNTRRATLDKSLIPAKFLQFKNTKKKRTENLIPTFTYFDLTIDDKGNVKGWRHFPIENFMKIEIELTF